MTPSDGELRDWCRWDQGSGLPTWLVSMMVHFAALTTLGLTVRPTPQGAALEPARTGGIVLVARSNGKADYFSDEPAGIATASVLVSPAADRPPVPDWLTEPALPGPQLQSAEMPAGANSIDLSAASAAPDGSGPTGPPGRGQAAAVETRVFGVRGRGTRFVYVFDRSSSMEGGPLLAAKRELIASLQNLQSVHQFQIIFYNQQPQLMS